MTKFAQMRTFVNKYPCAIRAQIQNMASTKFFLDCRGHSCLGFPDGLVLGIEDFPAIAYSQLAHCLRHESLDMEAVVDQLCAGEYFSDCQHHRGRQVGRDRLHGDAPLVRETAQYGAYRVRGHAANHGDKRPLAPFGRLVGQYGVDVPVAEARLVQ